ncbi:DUF2917 domain-containing protein [Desulfonatronum sp. SC1]|uniref:DUF2917 domain-containing protein n=1 Tax=Desulfonatronum sp. SC1 TaxID=2109626 RepID=UPI000D3257FB|nr:DUF2917 domain-containing protein [Desulfonatronum sp. SC1]PTN33459.1 hypothetical protein C6366_14385 [Desulfonatronum sp. SC1]
MVTGRCAGRIDTPSMETGVLQGLRKRITILGGDILVLAGLFLARRPVEITLRDRQIATIAGRKRVRVVCLSGRAWVTSEGDGKDYELRPGNEVKPGGWGKTAVTGYGPETRIAILR